MHFPRPIAKPLYYAKIWLDKWWRYNEVLLYVYFTSFVGEKEHFNINLEDEVVRGSIVVHNVGLKFPIFKLPQKVASCLSTDCCFSELAF